MEERKDYRIYFFKAHALIMLNNAWYGLYRGPFCSVH